MFELQKLESTATNSSSPSSCSKLLLLLLLLLLRSHSTRMSRSQMKISAVRAAWTSDNLSTTAASFLDGMPRQCHGRSPSLNSTATLILIISTLLAPAAASFGQSFVRIDGTSARDRSQRSSSSFSALQASAQLGLGDVSVLSLLGCPPSTQSALSALDTLTSFEGVAIANVTQHSGYQTVAIDVWGGRNAADSYLVCVVKTALPQSNNGSSASMQFVGAHVGSGHSATSTIVQDATATVSFFRSWLGGDPYYASSYNYRRYDDFAAVMGQAFASLLPDAPCSLVTFGDSGGVSSAHRYRMTFKLPFTSPTLTPIDFWVAPTLFASLRTSALPSSSIQALVVRGSKFGVRTRSAEDAFPAQPSNGCCPVATVPSPLYPGRCALCSQQITSGASVATWQPLNGSTSASDAACTLPFSPSSLGCNQSSQTCSCRFATHIVIASSASPVHSFFRAARGEARVCAV